MSINMVDIVKFTFNVTEIGLSNLKLDTNCSFCSLLTLLDDYGVLKVDDFTFNLTGKYEYVSEPPLIGDIGNFTFELANTTFLVNSSTTWNEEEGKIHVDLADLYLEQEPFKMIFNGISDLADVTSRLITFVGNTFRNRLISILKFKGPKTDKTI